MSRRAGKTGVIWPNNRDVDDLVPYLDRLAAVALVFPTFRDGRAYSQARLLRERHGYRGELRATGQVLRDQFVFMLRAGFDAFEVKQGQPTRKRLPPRSSAIRCSTSRPATAASPRCIGACSCGIRRAPANERARAAGSIGAERRRDLPPARELDRSLRTASPAEVIATALQTVGRERLAVVSSFGTESAALLKVMADVDPAIPVVFLDTGWLFEETLAYRDTLIATLGLRDVRSIRPLEEALSREDPERELWFSDPDACCRIRKVEPLARALAPFSAWINGRKRFQGGLRADIAVVEQDGIRLKFNPFANVSREEIEAIYQLRRPAAASARGIGLSLGRVHALHQPDLAGRGCACRPLARPGQDGMRHPYRQDLVDRVAATLNVALPIRHHAPAGRNPLELASSRIVNCDCIAAGNAGIDHAGGDGHP